MHLAIYPRMMHVAILKSETSSPNRVALPGSHRKALRSKERSMFFAHLRKKMSDWLTPWRVTMFALSRGKNNNVNNK
jgi:hypothetical protein